MSWLLNMVGFFKLNWIPIAAGVAVFGGLLFTANAYVQGKVDIGVLESQKEFIEQQAAHKISQAQREKELAIKDAESRAREKIYNELGFKSNQEAIEKAKADPNVNKIYDEGKCNFPGYTLR